MNRQLSNMDWQLAAGRRIYETLKEHDVLASASWPEWEGASDGTKLAFCIAAEEAQ